MMRGFVNDDCEAQLQLRLRGPTGVEIAVQSTIDTGFDGQVTLSPAFIRSLGLFAAMEGDAVFANQSTTKVVYYSAELFWLGRWISVLVMGLQRDSYVGMRMLASHELKIACVPGGAVEIAPLS